MSDEKALREKIAAVRDEVGEIEAKANLLGTALRLANERADAAEAQLEAVRSALRGLERTATAMYRAAARHGNYGETENRFADEDPSIASARAALAADEDGA